MRLWSFRPSIKENIRATPVPASIHHFGYLDEHVSRKQKHIRNLSLLEKERNEPDHDPWCEYHLAGEYYRTEDYIQAFKLINESIAAFLERGQLPPSITYKLKYEILFRHGSMRGAWPGILHAIELYPDYVDLHFYKGVLLMELGHLLEAVQTFERCLELGDISGKHLSLRGVGSFLAASELATCMDRLGKSMEAHMYRKLAMEMKNRASFPTSYSVHQDHGIHLRQG